MLRRQGMGFRKCPGLGSTIKWSPWVYILTTLVNIFPQNMSVKKFIKSVNIWRRYVQNTTKVCDLFFRPPCIALFVTWWWSLALSVTFECHFRDKLSEQKSAVMYKIR